MEINFKKSRSYSKKLERQKKLEERKDIREWIKHSSNDLDSVTSK